MGYLIEQYLPIIGVGFFLFCIYLGITGKGGKGGGGKSGGGGGNA